MKVVLLLPGAGEEPVKSVVEAVAQGSQSLMQSAAGLTHGTGRHMVGGQTLFAVLLSGRTQCPSGDSPGGS